MPRPPFTLRRPLLGLRLLLSLALFAPAPPLHAGRAADAPFLARLREEGLQRSRVVEMAEHLADRIGPRLTGSEALEGAHAWSRERFASWGLESVRLESFPFGRGWSVERTHVRLVKPYSLPLQALARAWSPGTGGVVRGPVALVNLIGPEDLDGRAGTLRGKIVLTDDLAVPFEPSPPRSGRFSAEDLAALARPAPPNRPPPFDRLQAAADRWRQGNELARRLSAEGVLATVEPSGMRDGILTASQGASFLAGDPRGIPSLTLAREAYSRLLRLIRNGEPVELEIEVTTSDREAPEAHNTLAEIPGSELAREIVMAGAHLDSWHAGGGATDNAAGCAIVLEAARLLRSAGARPRRTIRFALWGGEEQGELGSRAYVAAHLSRPAPAPAGGASPFPWFLQPPGERTPLPEAAGWSVYFNLDGGAGKVRGLYAQENQAALPLLRRWLEPLADLGAATVSPRRLGSSDHLSFESAGFAAFPLLQDPLDYDTHTYHSSLDNVDHLRPEDLKQAAVVLASLLYQAAQAPERAPPPSAGAAVPP